MTLPIKHLIYGEAGSGKSYYARTLFESEYIDPKRVLVLDNHGSWRAFTDIPRVSDDCAYGVLNLSFDEPGRLREIANEVRHAALAGAPMYDAIVVDDISEHALTHFDVVDRKTPAKDKRQAWGVHYLEMCAVTRLLEPAVTQAHLIVAARAGRMPLPLSTISKGAKSRGEDDRPLCIRPALRGQYGEWLPYFFDLISYAGQELDGDEIVNFQLFTPVGDILVKNRWRKELPARMDWPTFDKVWSLLPNGP